MMLGMNKKLMREKILSVSVAAYNVATTLREALDPFKENFIRDCVEVIIVDDGSNDNTASLAAEYQREFPNTFKLISKNNGGWGSTLTTAIQFAHGKYFKQLDGDDYFSHENLKDYINFLQNIDADMIHTPYVTFNDKKHAILNVLGAFQGDYRFFPRDRVVSIDECEDLIPAMHSLTVKTEILQKNHVSITEHCFYTDVEFILKVFNLSKTVAFFELPIYYYRLARSGQSMSVIGVRKHYKDHQRMLKTMLSYYKNNVTNPVVKKIFERRLDGVCKMQYVFYLALQCNKQQKQELREYDTYLKKEYPDFYSRVSKHHIRLIRKLNFNGYWLIGHIVTLRDRRKKINIFEGC